MGYERHYSGTPEEIDTAAIADIREYLTETQWEALMWWANMVNEKVNTINDLNIAFGFIGISGRPFHAFCRRYCLNEYRAWMAEEPDPIETDERGYRLGDK